MFVRISPQFRHDHPQERKRRGHVKSKSDYKWEKDCISVRNSTDETNVKKHNSSMVRRVCLQRLSQDDILTPAGKKEFDTKSSKYSFFYFKRSSRLSWSVNTSTSSLGRWQRNLVPGVDSKRRIGRGRR